MLHPGIETYLVLTRIVPFTVYGLNNLYLYRFSEEQELKEFTVYNIISDKQRSPLYIIIALIYTMKHLDYNRFHLHQ